MAQASDVLAVAVREIGTVEQSGNRQKYGKAYGMDGVYWCMQFVWWCFQQVDKTLFMDGGKTTVGTHDELMDAVPMYRQLYESQTAAKGGGPA